MRGDVWSVYSRSKIRVEARRRINTDGGHNLFVPIILIDIVGSHGNIIARGDVVLRPDVVVGEWRQAFERQTRDWIVDVGYTVIVAHSLPGDVPSEKVISDSWRSAEVVIISCPDA